MNQPLLSIVIANYNYGRFLEKAIQSVITQEVGSQVELIICDAASTDNSVSVIKKYEHYISWWCSEPDGGQSAAFNKGFSHAHGKYLTWLNADDIMVPGSLRVVCESLRQNIQCDWFTGNFFRFIDETDEVVEIAWGPNFYPYVLQACSSPLVVFGPTSIFSKKIYDTLGPMDERLHYVMDTDLWTRFVVAGVKQIRIRCFCWGFRIHDRSKTEGDEQRKLLLERLEAEHKVIIESSGYRCSLMLQLLLKIWRVLDGSYLRSLYYKVCFLGRAYNNMRGCR